MGSWLQMNGEAIYGSKPWICQNDTVAGSNVWYTSKIDEKFGEIVYAILLNWPDTGILELGCPIPTDKSKASLLESREVVKWSKGDQSVMILEMPLAMRSRSSSWVIKFIALENSGNFI